MTKDDSGQLSGLRLVAHPLRLKLLSLLTGRTMSAAEAARELGQTQANVSYHIRRLVDGGLLELVDEQPIRGGVAKRYTHNPQSGESLGVSGSDDFASLMRSIANELIARAASYEAGTEFAFTDADVSIPATKWPQVQEAARDLGRLIHDLAEEPASGESVQASVTVAAFETARSPSVPRARDTRIAPPR